MSGLIRNLTAVRDLRILEVGQDVHHCKSCSAFHDPWSASEVEAVTYNILIYSVMSLGREQCLHSFNFVTFSTLKTIYYSDFNAIISYGFPLWGNSPHAIKIFRMQKRLVRIMMACKSRVSCRNMFRRLEILPFVSQYTLSIMLFVVKNKNYFTLNSENYTKVQDNLKLFISP
jgi:hypothetical protein